MEYHSFGKTGLNVPEIVYGTSCLGNLYEELSSTTKLDITREWFAHQEAPVLIDSAGKYGAGLALETIGRNLRKLQISPEQVIISNKLGWKRVPLESPEPTFEPGLWANLEHDAEQCISYEGILECWEHDCKLLGEEYRPQLLSVHDPDEYLAAATSPEDRRRRLQDIVSAYRALQVLKQQGKAIGIGVGAKDWRVIKEIVELVDLDWVMLANSLTIYRHPTELLLFVNWLSKKEIAIINSAVFHAGFLAGGKYFDYRIPSPHNPSDRRIFAWREQFLLLCKQFDIQPAVACIQFSLAPSGITSIALNTSRPEQIAKNVDYFSACIPDQFWAEAKSVGIIDSDVPFLGKKTLSELVP